MAALTIKEGNRLSRALLREVPRQCEYPFYVERWERSKTFSQHNQAVYYKPQPIGYARCFQMFLESGHIGELIRAANLPPDELAALTLWLFGYSFREIGAVRGHSRQYAHRLFKWALIALRAAYRSDAQAGIAEVYDELTRQRHVHDYYA